MDSNSELAVIDWIHQLGIADGLKKILINSGLTIDSIGR
jgi:3-dehydroquinate dehydratase